MSQRSFLDEDSGTAVMEPPRKPAREVPPEVQAKDRAIEQVLDNAGLPWQERAERVLRGMTASEVTGEDVRLACEAQGVRPHHHNAWGGLTSRFVSLGLLVPTGRYVAMKAKGSHARKTQVYYRRG